MNRYVLCMKWGTKYDAAYVNRLYSMVRRHLTLPFDMVCLTDDPRGIDDAITCLPIPPLPLPEGIPERGWKKLTTFLVDLHGLRGQALFLDIDLVITDSLDDFFLYEAAHSDAVVIIKDWKKPWRGVGNSSVYRFTLGAHPGLVPYFADNFATISRQFRHEQAFLSDYMRRHHHLEYWPANWCQSFKYHCLYPIPLAFLKPARLPLGAKIIVFHGEINPPDAITGGTGKWYRHVLPTPWVKEAWR